MKKIILFLVAVAMLNCKGQEKKEAEKQVQEPQIFGKVVSDVNLASGTLERIENFPTKFIEPRPVDVWLPEGYTKDKKYAVLYMHDGQVLFDETTTWNKQEWQVDEWASQLMKDGKTKDFIVVAIHNISEIRTNDYLPKQPILDNRDEVEEHLNRINLEFDLGKINSDGYLKFLVEELKPYIDSTYSVLSEKENTVIMGSSMGGLISMYAICEYPEVFGGAACLSTHWIGTYSNVNNPIPNAFLEYMKQYLPDNKNHKLYFDYGTKTLDSLYLPYQEAVTKVLDEKGHTINKKFEGHAHDEISWAKRLDVPLTFLLKKND